RTFDVISEQYYSTTALVAFSTIRKEPSANLNSISIAASESSWKARKHLL
ncbi:535_t:CDS:1, partial [Funneliformis mosseae]